VVTQGLISAKQWNADFKPTSIRAFRHEDTYVAFYTDGSTHKGWVYDPRAQQAALSTLTANAETRGGFEQSDNGELYLIHGSNIVEYRNGTSPNTLTFKSKVFVTPYPISFSWMSVDAEAYPVELKVFGDGSLIAHYSISSSGNTFTQTTTVPSSISNATLQEPVMRLPSTVAKEWEIQVSGTTTINEVCIAQSIDEVKAL
jgi:hypothetical protein